MVQFYWTNVARLLRRPSVNKATNRVRFLGALGILGVTAALVAGARFSEHRSLDAALTDYQHRSQAEAAHIGAHLGNCFNGIYEGARTIARLPGVRSIDRYATNFDGDARRTVQEIYNNLASSVALSELYIVPVDMDPDTADPATGQLEEPIATFDRLIVERNADQPAGASRPVSDVEEIEIFEYRLMRQQLAWFRVYCPTQAAVNGLEYPVLCGPEVVTCDNTRYSPTHPDDKDRSGLVFSVPFFGLDGRLKGCISAVLLTAAIQDLLPDGEYALGASGYGYTVLGRGDGPAGGHRADLERGQAAADLLCSFTSTLQFRDAQSNWVLWRGRPNAAFHVLPEVIAAQRVAGVSYAGVGIFGASALIVLFMLTRHLNLIHTQRDTLEQEVTQRTSELREMALTDKLTGLPNRALIADRIDRALARSARGGVARYAVLFLDFDRFKVINDTLGHEAGDRLLKGITDRLRTVLRESDSVGRLNPGSSTAARLGGDEFVVLLEDLARVEDADAVAERLVNCMSEPHHIGGQQFVSTVSIGVLRGDNRYDRAADVLRDADTAMYEAKAAGKGRYVVFDAAMRDRILRRASLERDVRDAAARNELFLEYQPVVRLLDRRVEGVEALVRWRHATFGLVSPAEFIPIAEDSVAIARVTEWVMRAACAQVALWKESLSADSIPRMAVNISRAQISDKSLAPRLGNIAREFGIEPSALCLEITETAIMRDQNAAIGALGRLKDAGFHLALDDFGTGYSSLSTLHLFPLDLVKLDRSFIANSSMAREHAALVHAVISLADNLGMQVIAEGVETNDQVVLLQALDCKYAQGYLFGRPASPDQIAECVTASRRAA